MAEAVERTKAVMQRARREGKRIGRRHRMSPSEVERAHSMKAQGASVRTIAIALRTPRATVVRALAAIEQQNRARL
jgi:DNA invertase Pin-like site-specific DNA recombinase